MAWPPFDSCFSRRSQQQHARSAANMSALRFVLLCTLAVFLFTQFVHCDEEGSLKSVEAKVSVAVEDLRKNVGELFTNITSYIQTEISKNPEAAEIYKNITTSLSAAAQQMKDAVASVTPKP